MTTLILHTTCGTVKPTTLVAASAMHNAFLTDGPQPGIEVARSLGDVSHAVYTPAEGTGGQPGATPRDLLFLDYWTDPDGMETFFANPFAQQAGNRLYSWREESEWAPALAAVTFQVPAPAGKPARYITTTQAPVRSAENAIAALGALTVANLPAARRRGQLSHALFVRQPATEAARPAANARHGTAHTLTTQAQLAAILAVDFWSTLDGLTEHYRDPAAMNGFDAALAGPPATSIWQQANGFTEW